MDRERILQYYRRLRMRGEENLELMSFKVENILLVSPLYDAFVIEQDGGLSDKIFGEYHQLNLSTPPTVTFAPNAEDAMKLLAAKRFDLVASMMRTGEGSSPFELASKVKQLYPGLPFVLLLNHPSDLQLLENRKRAKGDIDDVFFWSGDSKLFLAMVKSVEDRRNLDRDARLGLVRVVLLIEDSITYSSRFLPILYTEIMRLTRTLISEEVTESDKRQRMKLRPKLITARNYEEALLVYNRYKDNLLCVISDVEYEKGGKLEGRAGLQFMEMVRAQGCRAPLLLHSLNREVAAAARGLEINFLDKNSAHLNEELRSFIVDQLGFGDFVFRMDDGHEVARAGTIEEFLGALTRIPPESLLFHARNNHYSAWLLAHGEVPMAKVMEPVKAEDFPDVARLRSYLLECFSKIRHQKNQGRVVSVEDVHRLSAGQVVRLAPGSLGGKGRGLAFLNSILAASDYGERFPDVEVRVPLTAIVGTDEFDRFLDSNHLGRDLASLTDEDIRRRFLDSALSADLLARLEWFLDRVNAPLAVRSSGLLEDSQAYPFAGVYDTFMIPNSAPALAQRLDEAASAVKLVFASVFVRGAREYLEGVGARLEDEKMAVIIQEVVGRHHDDYFYPDVSGVAQSYNFYPVGPMKHADGIASIALGLGKAVVEGGGTVRFCPRYEDLEILSHRDTVANSQKAIWALDLRPREATLGRDLPAPLAKLTVADAKRHGTMRHAGSVWDHENDLLVDDPDRPGLQVVTFNGILKYGAFPLTEILRELLVLGETALGVPVEMEFAAVLGEDTPAFNLLQVRPLGILERMVTVDVRGEGASSDAFVYSSKAMGNGCLAEVRDLVFVDGASFDSTKTMEIKAELQDLNRRFREEGGHYMLIGPGRWGSRDRFLGVPVAWADISRARAIVEADIEGFRIEASQGTHFLHNLVAMNVPYLKVGFDAAGSWVDWDWLRGLPVVSKGRFCTHARVEAGLLLKVDGRSGKAAIYKTGAGVCEGEG